MYISGMLGHPVEGHWGSALSHIQCHIAVLSTVIQSSFRIIVLRAKQVWTAAGWAKQDLNTGLWINSDISQTIFASVFLKT